jgi:hypothetical protein
MADDPIALLDQLTPEQITARIKKLDSERRALCALLRAARARDRQRRRQEVPRGKR